MQHGNSGAAGGVSVGDTRHSAGDWERRRPVRWKWPGYISSLLAQAMLLHLVCMCLEFQFRFPIN